MYKLLWLLIGQLLGYFIFQCLVTLLSDEPGMPMVYPFKNNFFVIFLKTLGLVNIKFQFLKLPCERDGVYIRVRGGRTLDRTMDNLSFLFRGRCGERGTLCCGKHLKNNCKFCRSVKAILQSIFKKLFEHEVYVKIRLRIEVTLEVFAKVQVDGQHYSLAFVSDRGCEIKYTKLFSCFTLNKNSKLGIASTECIN